MQTYNGVFDNWDDVVGNFGIDMEEPDEVLYAEYSYEDWEGSATVFYRNGDMYYEVNGGHCSCYGLERQWSPEEYTKDIFIAMLQRRPDDPEYKYILDKVLAHG